MLLPIQSTSISNLMLSNRHRQRSWPLSRSWRQDGGPGGTCRNSTASSLGYRRGEPVVWDIRLKVKPGMKIALVGPTGCGKSTLVNLLMRFYDPTWGEIRLDDVPIKRIPTRERAGRLVCVVLQDPFVFRLSVVDNIRYGAIEVTDDAVQAAARAALVHDFASSLPEGYATIVLRLSA